MAGTVRRQTRQKLEVRAALVQSNDFVSAQDLFAKLRADGSGIGLATVYRNLNEMVGNDEADTYHAAGGEQRYRSCSRDHHHHLICTECGKASEIQAPLEDWVESVAAQHGFTRVHHVVDLFGVCSDCAAAS
ncbi:Fur family transcriptional regulator [Jiangella mangrovi]|uniref:Fur family ferric uptake transcriptional regulator n=1 Tax=Jiangella mangrovi TaxID=1524084 RepID=A0A7W9GRX4_9ACTN|nr:transcriptional repressor [Jiangella mangrovi]MBB5788812.1 Fur family ferric uptake transcriptional regulator [Jiangella mangrovi]